MRGIFISKNKEELIEPLLALQQQNLLEAQSLIEFRALPFECPPAHQILFISSIRAAHYFFEHCTSDALIACAGLETAKKVAELHQKQVHFIAAQSGQPKLEAQRFNEWRNGRSVCFPSSQLSIGSYAAPIPDHEKTVLKVYETVFRSSLIKPKDIYVFSSPSNVAAFFQVNQIAASAKVVAWGSSTESALQQHGIQVTKVLNGDQQADLLTWLGKVL